MANFVYGSAKLDLVVSNIKLDTDTLKVMLVTATYTPVNTHTKRSDITNEVVGTGYTAGGTAVTGQSATRSGGVVTFTCSNLSWATATITARGAVFYKARGGASSADELLYYADFGADITSTAAAFNVVINGSGLFTIS